MTSKVRSFARSSHHSFPLSRRERGTGGKDILVRREQRTEAQNLKREEPRAKTFCGPVKIFCGPEKETWPSTNEWPRTETEPYRFVKEACGSATERCRLEKETGGAAQEAWSTAMRPYWLMKEA